MTLREPIGANPRHRARVCGRAQCGGGARRSAPEPEALVHLPNCGWTERRRLNTLLCAGFGPRSYLLSAPLARRARRGFLIPLASISSCSHSDGLIYAVLMALLLSPLSSSFPRNPITIPSLSRYILLSILY